MRALKSIRLINFQSHKNTLINFAGSGCLTVITGPSDNGKSAVIRALRWVFYNVPQGDGFIFNAEDKCTVSLVYDDGTTVERIRSRGGINRYHIYDSASKQGQVFEGFGIGVPLEVQQATGIRKLEIGDQSFLLNLSEQLDGPFLGKSVSGPARAKVLGKLAGTEEIDYASKETGTDLYRAKRQQEALGKNIELLQADIDDFHWINPREVRVASAEAFLADTRSKVADIGKLKLLIQQWEDFRVKVLALTKVVVGLQEVDKGLDSVRTAQDELTKGNALIALRASHFEEVLEAEQSKATLIRLDPVFRYASSMIDEMVEKSAKASRVVSICDQHERSSHAVLHFGRIVQMFSGIEMSNGYLRQAFNDNVQKATLRNLSDLYGQASISFVLQSRIMTRLLDIDTAEVHLQNVSDGNPLHRQLKNLSTNFVDTRDSVSDLKKAFCRFSEIEKVEGHLKQAFHDDLQLGRTKNVEVQEAYLTLRGQQCKQVVEDWKTAIKIAESEYLDLMSALGKCPTCGNDIDIKKLKEAI